MTDKPGSSNAALCSKLRLRGYAPILLCALVMIATQATQAQTFQVIHNFTGGADGGAPWAGLTMDQSGDFYGTAGYLGQHGSGTIFKLSGGGSGWFLKPLYSFKGGGDGVNPFSAVIFDASGNLYGTAAYGGIGDNGGYGTVYSVKPPGTPCSTAVCAVKKTPSTLLPAAAMERTPTNTAVVSFLTKRETFTAPPLVADCSSAKATHSVVARFFSSRLPDRPGRRAYFTALPEAVMARGPRPGSSSIKPETCTAQRSLAECKGDANLLTTTAAAWSSSCRLPRQAGRRACSTPLPGELTEVCRWAVLSSAPRAVCMALRNTAARGEAARFSS